MAPKTAEELFREGRLADAIAAQSAVVRAASTVANRRWFLAELLCFAEDWERADRSLDIVASQASELATAVNAFRQLLRGEQTRRQVMRDGRAPQILGAGAARLQPAVAALLCLREGKPAEALALIEEIEAAAPAAVGTRNDEQRFETFRDLDDVCSPFIEFITQAGEYHWVAPADLVALETKPLSCARDLLWRPARLAVRDGPAGDVYLPAIYVPDASHAAGSEDALRLGRRTEWREAPGAPVCGLGQRSFLVDEEDVPIHELGRLEFLAGAGGG
jgi:type VI secretion system protein ImpE